MKNFNKVKTTQLIEHTFCHSDVSMEENIYFFIFKDVDRASTQFCFVFFFKNLFFYFREGNGGRKRGRETSMCGCFLCTPYWGPAPQLRHVPWLGIKLATLWFTGSHSIHSATPAMAEENILDGDNKQRNNLAFGIFILTLDQKPEYYAYITKIS